MSVIYSKVAYAYTSNGVFTCKEIRKSLGIGLESNGMKGHRELWKTME